MAVGGLRTVAAMAAAFAIGGLAVTAVAEESHVAQALTALTAARTALTATRDNKGGHPTKAVALIAQAQAELQAVGP
jgi:hypothetical protein